MRFLKVVLKYLDQKHFSHISNRAKEVNTKLMEAQLQIESNSHDTNTHICLSILKAKATFLVEVERQFYSQKAKIDHLNLFDKSTKFLHALVRRNQKRNFIATICVKMAISLRLLIR